MCAVRGAVRAGLEPRRATINFSVGITPLRCNNNAADTVRRRVPLKEVPHPSSWPACPDSRVRILDMTGDLVL